jgi:hypothetical protein
MWHKQSSAGGNEAAAGENRQMAGHIIIIETLESYLEAGVGNAAAIQAKIAWHKAWLAERGVFVA